MTQLTKVLLNLPWKNRLFLSVLIVLCSDRGRTLMLLVHGLPSTGLGLASPTMLLRLETVRVVRQRHGPVEGLLIWPLMRDIGLLGVSTIWTTVV